MQFIELLRLLALSKLAVGTIISRNKQSSDIRGSTAGSEVVELLVFDELRAAYPPSTNKREVASQVGFAWGQVTPIEPSLIVLFTDCGELGRRIAAGPAEGSAYRIFEKL